MDLKNDEKAMEYFLQAHKKYEEWGALGKCDSLFKFVERSFSPQPSYVTGTPPL